MPISEYVFGFGSLVHEPQLLNYLGKKEFKSGDLYHCRLKGYRRCWNIAMDNRITLPKYKYYVNADTGERPEIYVTFLNIRPYANGEVAGVLFKVGEEQLEQLDKRERNYDRIEITQLLDFEPPGTSWVYIGKYEAELRYQKGVTDNSSVISRQYYDLVYEAYNMQGQAAALDYLETTDKPIVPFMNLKIVRSS